MNPRVAITLAVLGTVLCLGPASADPTDRAPMLALNIHGSVPEAAAIGKQVIAAEQQLKTLADSAEAGTRTAQQLSKGYVMGQQVLWQIGILEHYGEPAARDLSLRSAKKIWWIDHGIVLFKETPEGAKVHQNAQQFFASPKVQKMKANAIEKLIQLVQQKNFPAAEKLLIKTYSDLWPYSGFIHPYDRGAIFKPFEDVAGAINSEMSRQRRATAHAVLAEKSQQWLAQRDSFTQEIEGVPAQLAAASTASLDGQSLSGPDAMKQLSQRWSGLHLELTKVAMLDFALSGQNQTKWAEEAKQLTTAMEKCFSEMISADAKKLAPEVASTRYFEYLDQLGSMIGRVDQWNPEIEFAAPLAALASQGRHTQSVANYLRATSEILRWREKVASAQTKSLQQEFAPVTAELPQKLLSRSDYEGIYEMQQQHPLPLMNHSSYLVFPHLVEQTMATKISASDVVRLDGEKSYFMSRMDNGIYCRLPSSFKVESGIAGLTNDLLVGADHPPLTLASATALATAELGEYETFGGEVAGVEWSGFATRFITFPPIAGPLVVRGQIPTTTHQREAITAHGLDSLAVQFSVTPQWVAHRYFVSKVSPSSD